MTNRHLISSSAFDFHNEKLFNLGFPCFFSSKDIKKWKIVDSNGNSIFCYQESTSPRLPGLKYPIVKNLTILSEFSQQGSQYLAKTLKEMGDKVFIITESYNEAALKFIKGLDFEETYFSQCKLIASPKNIAFSEKLEKSPLIRNFECGKDEEAYVYLYNNILGFLGNIIDRNFIEEIKSRPSFNPTGYFIAEQADHPVGFVTVEKEPWGGKGTGFGYIYQIGVDKKFHGAGLAEALLKKAADFAIKNCIRNLGVGVRSNNESALKFFKKYGFVEKYRTKGFIISL